MIIGFCLMLIATPGKTDNLITVWSLRTVLSYNFPIRNQNQNISGMCTPSFYWVEHRNFELSIGELIWKVSRICSISSMRNVRRISCYGHYSTPILSIDKLHSSMVDHARTIKFHHDQNFYPDANDYFSLSSTKRL